MKRNKAIANNKGGRKVRSKSENLIFKPEKNFSGHTCGMQIFQDKGLNLIQNQMQSTDNTGVIY